MRPIESDREFFIQSYVGHHSLESLNQVLGDNSFTLNATPPVDDLPMFDPSIFAQADEADTRPSIGLDNVAQSPSETCVNEVNTLTDNIESDVTESATQEAETKHETLEEIAARLFTRKKSTKMKVDERLLELKRKKRIKGTTQPMLDERKLRKINTFVGIHLDPTALAWASFQIDRDGENGPTLTINDYGYEKTGYDRAALWQLLVEMEKFEQKMPSCDAYIIENVTARTFRANIGARQVNDMVQMNQCVSMLATLLAKRSTSESYVYDPRVLFMQRNMMGRFFNLMVGDETTSTLEVMQSLIKRTYASISNPFDERMSNDLIFLPKFSGHYWQATNIKREYMGKTALIGTTFYRLALLAAIPPK